MTSKNSFLFELLFKHVFGIYRGFPTEFLEYFIHCVLEERENVSYFRFAGARKSRLFVETANWPPLWVFPEALGHVFEYVASSPLGLLRMHNHDFLLAFLHATRFSIITLHIICRTHFLIFDYL